MCIKIYNLDPAKFFSTPGLAWQTALKKSEVKLEILIDIVILALILALMVEKRIRERICSAVYQYTKANDKCTKDYATSKQSSYLKYCGVNNLHGWAM